MKVVLIGFGAIGKRHVNNLIKLGINDITLFRRKKSGNEFDLNEIDELNEIVVINPNFIIVSNPLALHYNYLEFLMKHNFNILCEKPLVDKPNDLYSLKQLLNDYSGLARIIFNLRYHPCIKKVKEILKYNELGKIHFARFLVGQYLPDWRGKTNHLDSYSANKKMGGGVVLDLVHEIDIAEYLLKKPQEPIYSIVGKVSNVTVDSEDIAEIIYKTETNVVVNIHMDYLYQGYTRNFLISGSIYNLHCDLFTNEIKITNNQNKLIKSFIFKDFQRNEMYVNLMRDYIGLISSDEITSELPSFEDNQSVMETCFKIKNI